MKGFLLYLRQVAYTIFAIVVFIGFAIEMTLIGFVLITICGATDKHKLTYHRIIQKQSRFAISIIPGTTFDFVNPQEERFESPCIIVSNHQSQLDLIAIMMLTPNLIILTKDWVWHNPFYGLVIRYADFFPVSETEKMTKNLARMVEKGYSIMVFPEGTRSEDCRIHRFHKGAFYLAEKLQLDIVPVYLDGFGKVLPKKGRMLRPGHMTTEIMPRIRRADVASVYNSRELTRHVHKMYVSKENEKVHNHR